MSKWTCIWPLRITSNICIRPIFSTWWTSPNFALRSLLEMQKGLSTPLSPPGWTIVMHVPQSGSLAKASRSCSTFSAARILMRVRKYDNTPPILKSLHRLPVSFRIEYKVSLLAHQCIHGDAPPPPPRNLSLHNALHVPSALCYGRSGFCSASPSLWNALPDHLRTPQSVDAFKCGLKTHLFSRAFAWFFLIYIYFFLCSYIVALWDLFKYKVCYK